MMLYTSACCLKMIRFLIDFRGILIIIMYKILTCFHMLYIPIKFPETEFHLKPYQYTWSSISAGKWETQISALLEIRTIGIIL